MTKCNKTGDIRLQTVIKRAQKPVDSECYTGGAATVEGRLGRAVAQGGVVEFGISHRYPEGMQAGLTGPMMRLFCRCLADPLSLIEHSEAEMPDSWARAGVMNNKAGTGLATVR